MITSNINATSLAKDNYTGYAIYVNKTRTLPSIYDGFKEVQRRLIYATSQFSSMTKSAELEGATMKYHPHGGCYGPLVGMACQINNLPLYDVQGNFGGYDTGAAASRYTACKLSKIARFIYCQFIDYAPMIVGEIGKLEPEYLPCLIPYSLFEGTSGIGVGLSSDAIPLDLMDLINYYIDYINNDYKFNHELLPRPEFGSSIIDMEDNEWKEAVKGYDTSFWIYPVIVKESENIFVINSLYKNKIDSVLKKLRKWYNEDQVDFRDETTNKERYVFEVVDNSVNVNEFEKYLKKITSKKVHNTRVYDKNGVSVYSNIDYVITNQIKKLNLAIDTKLNYEKEAIIKKSLLLRALSFFRTTDVFNDITNKSSEFLINKMMKYSKKQKDIEINEDLCKEIIKKPISYLTKDHDDELDNLDKSLKEIENHNRKEYLVNMYEELKSMIEDHYNSRLHTIPKSKVIKNPRIKLISSKELLIKGKGRGIYFDNYVWLVGSNGYIYKKSVSSNIESSVELNYDCDIVGVCSDKCRYIEFICNDNTHLVFDTEMYKYDKAICNLYDNQKVVKCNQYWEDEFPEDMKYLIKQKVSRTLR